MNLLFICSRNRLRSPTAEALFTDITGIETASAGTSPDAENPISLDLIEWADIVYVMERVHRQRLNAKFQKALKSKKLTVLNIPDNYEYMDPALISILKSKLARHLP